MTHLVHIDINGCIFKYIWINVGVALVGLQEQGWETLYIIVVISSAGFSLKNQKIFQQRHEPFLISLLLNTMIVSGILSPNFNYLS